MIFQLPSYMRFWVLSFWLTILANSIIVRNSQAYRQLIL